MIVLTFNGRMTDHKAVNDLIFSHATLFGYTEDGLAKLVFIGKDATEVIELVKPALRTAVFETRLATTIKLVEYKELATTMVTFGVDKSVIINRLD